MKNRTWMSILLTLSVSLGILLAMGLTASAAEYDLWIKDVQVTDENKGDILGDGIFSYDSNGRILSIAGDCTDGEGKLGGCSKYTDCL